MDAVKLPYGISDFRELRRKGYYFVDKSPFIRMLEDDAISTRYTIFLRPRRFGKSLLISMLEHYYDVGRRDEFEELFGGLAIARDPTPERNRYLVLRLEFTGISVGQGADVIQEDFYSRLLGRLRYFMRHYARLIPDVVRAWQSTEHARRPATLLQEFLELVATCPYQLYLLIDEYDNFTNELIARGSEQTYYELVQRAGFVKEFFKTVKEGTATGTISRVFITGVSPVTLDDLTSGANIFSNITLDEAFNTMGGFTEQEVATLVDRVLDTRPYSLDRRVLLDDLRRYYDGYVFSQDSTERVYNPAMVLHFMRRVKPPDRYPKNLLDHNVRMDYGRLRSLLFTSDNRPRPEPVAIVRSLLSDRVLEADIRDSFPLSEAYREQYFVSLLFYLGMVTIQGVRRNLLRLVVPNYVIDQMIWQTMSDLLEDVAEVQVRRDLLSGTVGDMAYDGRIDRFLEMVFHGVIVRLSNRDLIRLDEKAMKFVLLTYLSLTDLFYPFSEFELNAGYSDLVLTLNRRYRDASYNWILELKYLKVSEGSEESVSRQLDEADGQLRRYLADERLAGVAGPDGWKAASLVFVGTEALYWRELGGERMTLRREGAGSDA